MKARMVSDMFMAFSVLLVLRAGTVPPRD